MTMDNLFNFSSIAVKILSYLPTRDLLNCLLVSNHLFVTGTPILWQSLCFSLRASEIHRVAALFYRYVDSRLAKPLRFYHNLANIEFQKSRIRAITFVIDGPPNLSRDLTIFVGNIAKGMTIIERLVQLEIHVKLLSQATVLDFFAACWEHGELRALRVFKLVIGKHDRLPLDTFSAAVRLACKLGDSRLRKLAIEIPRELLKYQWVDCCIPLVKAIQLIRSQRCLQKLHIPVQLEECSKETAATLKDSDFSHIVDLSLDVWSISTQAQFESLSLLLERFAGLHQLSIFAHKISEANHMELMRLIARLPCAKSLRKIEYFYAETSMDEGRFAERDVVAGPFPHLTELSLMAPHEAPNDELMAKMCQEWLPQVPHTLYSLRGYLGDLPLKTLARFNRLNHLALSIDSSDPAEVFRVLAECHLQSLRTLLVLLPNKHYLSLGSIQSLCLSSTKLYLLETNCELNPSDAEWAQRLSAYCFGQHTLEALADSTLRLQLDLYKLCKSPTPTTRGL